jgi:hypothetical protein
MKPTKLLLCLPFVLAACSSPSAQYGVFADEGEQIAWIEGASVPQIGGDRTRDRTATIVVWTATIDGTRIVDKKELAEYDPGDTNQFVTEDFFFMPRAGYALITGWSDARVAHRIDLEGEKHDVAIHNGAKVFPSRDGSMIATVGPETHPETEIGFTDVASNQIVAVLKYPVAFAEKFVWDEQGNFWVHGIPKEALLSRLEPMPVMPGEVRCSEWVDDVCWRADTELKTYSANASAQTPVEVTDPECFVSATSSANIREDGREIRPGQNTDEPLIVQLSAGPVCVVPSM